MDPIVKEALKHLKEQYTFWLFCNNATGKERREANAKLAKIDKLLKE